MVFHKFVLEDGTEYSSDKIMSVTRTTSTVEGQDVEPGCACAEEVSTTLWTGSKGPGITEGSVVKFYTISDQGVVTLRSTLNAEKPTRASANTHQVLLYDNVSKLDVDMSDWLLENIDTFPTSLVNLVSSVCEHCGVSLNGDSISNPGHVVQRLPISGVTARDIVRWAAQLCGQFVRAAPDGNIEFAWYALNESVQIRATGSSEDVKIVRYFASGLKYEDYVVSPVDKVQVKQSEDDVGIIYPPDEEKTNVYAISCNPLSVYNSSDELSGIAESVYNVMRLVTYTPMSVSIPYTEEIKVGDIISITDRNGVNFRSYITKCVATGTKMSLTSVGNSTRDSSSAVNSKQYSGLEGRVFNLSVSVDGLKAETKDLNGKYANLEFDVDGFRTEVSESVSNLQDQIAGSSDRLDILEERVGFSITKDQLEIEIEKVKNGITTVTTTTGFTFDDEGLTVTKTGSEMSTQVTEDGMTISRSGTQVLVVDNQGVQATNLTANTFLILAGMTRFEACGDHIGCFWIGGG